MATNTEANAPAEAQRDIRQLARSADSSEEGDTHDENAWELEGSRCQDQLSGTLQATPQMPKVSAGAHAYAYVSTHTCQKLFHRSLCPTCRPQSLYQWLTRVGRSTS